MIYILNRLDFPAKNILQTPPKQNLSAKSLAGCLIDRQSAPRGMRRRLTPSDKIWWKGLEISKRGKPRTGLGQRSNCPLSSVHVGEPCRGGEACPLPDPTAHDPAVCCAHRHHLTRMTRTRSAVPVITDRNSPQARAPRQSASQEIGKANQNQPANAEQPRRKPTTIGGKQPW